MDNEIKEAVSAKLSKKELLQLIEIKIVSSVSEIADSNKVSKKLAKKIKEAAKIISVELHSGLKKKEKGLKLITKEINMDKKKKNKQKK